MYYTHYTDATLFIADTFDEVLKHEAQNNLLIASTIRIRDHGVEGNIMATIKSEEGNVLLSAIMTPPFNLVIYATDNRYTPESVALLAQSLYERGVALPGVISEKALASDFAAIYTTYSHQKTYLKLSMYVYTLSEINIVTKTSGCMRLATDQDLFYLPYWQVSFATECGLDMPTLEEAVTGLTRSIAAEKIYIWEEEHPVSVAAAGRKLLNGTTISFVYTPPHLRGRHYALSSVSTLSQKLLDDGFQFVALFADTNNPVSNKIYQQIGFKRICEYNEIQFV